MQEVDLDHEGVKKILLVEITRNIKNAQLTKLDSTTDVKKYESLLKIAKDKETQTNIIPFFPINQKHLQRQCPVKKCIQVC